MDRITLIKAMEGIERLLSRADKKLEGGMSLSETKDMAHEINNARNIAAGIKALLEMEEE